MLRKKSALRIFTSLLNFALGFVRVFGISHIADCPPHPPPEAGGAKWSDYDIWRSDFSGKGKTVLICDNFAVISSNVFLIFVTSKAL